MTAVRGQEFPPPHGFQPEGDAVQVRMKMPVSGTREGQPWPGRGETLDVPDAEGAKLCASGIAEPVAQKPSERAEKATEPESEQRKGKRRADAS